MAARTRDAGRIDWERQEDREWAAEFELRLALGPGLPAGMAERVLAEVREAVTESGQGARELYGEPREYAAEVRAERTADEHRARTDLTGSTPGERFTGSLLMAGVGGLALSVLGWIGAGLWITVTWSGAVAVAAVLAAVVLTGTATALWAAGRPRAACASGAGAALGVLLTATALTTTLLPGGSLFALPAPVLTVLALAPAAVGLRLDDEAVTSRFLGSGRPEAADDEQWLRRLAGLLRGSHGVPRARALAHVAEAREHLAAAGGGAAEEFGSVHAYALRLAEGTALDRRVTRRKLWAGLLFLPLVVLVGFDTVTGFDRTSVWDWVIAAALVYLPCHLALTLRDYRRGA